MKSAFRTTLLAAATLAAFGASSAFAAGRPDLVAQGLAQGKPHVAGELIIQFRDGASDGDKVRALKRANGERVEMLARGRDRLDVAGDLELVRVRGQANIAEAIAALQADGNVEFVEPNWIVQHAATGLLVPPGDEASLASALGRADGA